MFQVHRQAGDFGSGIEEIATPGENQMVHMLDDFATVREKREPYPDPDEAVQTLKVLDALAKSAFDGKEVEVGQPTILPIPDLTPSQIAKILPCE